jgi:hypothetical protein
MKLHMQVNKLGIFAAWQIMLQLHMPGIDQNREFKTFLNHDFKTNTELTSCRGTVAGSQKQHGTHPDTVVNYLTFHSNFGSQVHVFAEDYRLIIKNQPDNQHFNLQHLYEEGKKLLHLPAIQATSH